MSRTAALLTLAAALSACAPAEHYGFVTTLGKDTVAVEHIMKTATRFTSDEVDRWPRVRRRHTVADLNPDGTIRKLVMDISEPGAKDAADRDRHFEVEIGADSLRINATSGATTKRRAFPKSASPMMVHVSQDYGLIELYMAAALNRAATSHLAPGDSVHMDQFYADREFDDFPLHDGWVRPGKDGSVDLWHGWISGMATAQFDALHRMLSYSGQGTTYKVKVERIAKVPDVETAASNFEAAEVKAGGQKALSVRDTAHAEIGRAKFTIDYGRPLARGRTLLGDVIPFGEVWRTGANAATQFTTSAPISIGGLNLAAGTYTLWTLPKSATDVTLIVNAQTGQWGTDYDGSRDIGGRSMKAETLPTASEMFTIAVRAADATHGDLVMDWGNFRWSVPIVVR